MKKIFNKIFLALLFLVLSGLITHVNANVISDTTPPVITLLGDAAPSITQGTTYTDAGATAQDDVDGDITSQIIETGTVDINTPGTYVETYNVSDASGNPATAVTRTLTVTTPVIPTETIIVRSGDTLIWKGDIPLPAGGTESINDINGNPHTVNTRSVLALVKDAETTSGAFTLSNLTYYDSFGAFYFKCITPTGGAELCDNWQYAVGNVTPWTSIDQTILTGGETVGIYYGTNHRVAFDNTTIIAGDSLTATAESYNYVDNSWSALSGVSIGITTPNPSDPWNPIVVSKTPVDTNGKANISIADVGAYTAGIDEDYYFPSYSITVNPIPTSGGGGGGNLPAFNVPNAISYLKSTQASDGSFGGSTLYTDWAAIALASYNVSDVSVMKLLEYFSTHNAISSILTDNERHSMALLSLGQNPYSYGGVNYIDSIVKSFDGKQFGDTSLVNDDVFALITLSKSGYTASDEIISKDIAFVISKQSSDGSWEGSIDMTAAAIEALSAFSNGSGVSNAMTSAGAYLQKNQDFSGGWGNVSSSSWVAQAMNKLGASWVNGGHTPGNYFGGFQTNDGAASPMTESIQNRIWATSYAIPGVLGMSWSNIMHAVSKPTVSTDSTGGNIIVDDIQTKDKPVDPKPIVPKQEIIQESVVTPTFVVQAKPEKIVKPIEVKNTFAKTLPKPTLVQKEVSTPILLANAGQSGQYTKYWYMGGGFILLVILGYIAKRIPLS